VKSGRLQWRRMTLRRAEGRVYLDRWGVGSRRIGAVFVHRMQAPDPGQDLHDHPWTFVSLVLKGRYTEHRCAIREASGKPYNGGHVSSDDLETRERWSVRRMRLDECHRVVACDNPTWTLVLCGPVRRRWGFYTPDGYMDEARYDETVRVHRRDLWEEGGNVEQLLATCNDHPWLGSCPVHGNCSCPSEMAAPYQWDCPLHGSRTRMRS